MLVKELITKLQQFPEDMQVVRALPDSYVSYNVDCCKSQIQESLVGLPPNVINSRYAVNTEADITSVIVIL